MKRTTLILEETCMDAVRALAHKQSRNMSAVVNELLRDGIRRQTEPAPLLFDLPVHSLGKPRINIADRDALERAMEEA